MLVAGFGGDHLSWGFQYAALSARYRVIAFDNRGCGRSESPDGPWTTRAMADDTLGLMDRLEIERAHVVGVSLGGMIAQEVALARPERVRSLQLYATCARPDHYVAALVANLRAIRAGLGRQAAQRAMALWLFAATTFNERPALVETLLHAAETQTYPQHDAGFVGQSEAVLTHDTLGRLPSLTCPTLVGVGEEDLLTPLRFATEIARAIPRVELRTVPQAGHALFWEQPPVFNALCLDFLAKVRGLA